VSVQPGERDRKSSADGVACQVRKKGRRKKAWSSKGKEYCLLSKKETETYDTSSFGNLWHRGRDPLAERVNKKKKKRERWERKKERGATIYSQGEEKEKKTALALNVFQGGG